ncbi:hypothetical protein PFLA_a2879 [Pseudoalteromonas flavipulchra NCIMB 2033 = ATCC BAA-314]|nr:hypothetical protein [Pseudoalteromonas flavipulchra NCIMB 2033 = ATCC BAA-314]
MTPIFIGDYEVFFNCSKKFNNVLKFMMLEWDYLGNKL